MVKRQEPIASLAERIRKSNRDEAGEERKEGWKVEKACVATHGGSEEETIRACVLEKAVRGDLWDCEGQLVV